VLVAQIQSLQVHSTNLIVKLDDGTAQVESRQWIEQGIGGDYGSELTRQGIIEHAYVRVMGTIKSFQDKRHFNVMIMHPIIPPGAPADRTNPQREVFFHLLDALNAKMVLTKGTPNAMTGVQSTNPDASAYHAQSSTINGRTDQYAGLSPMQRRIIAYISNSASSADGVHVTDLTKGLGPNINAEEISDALDKLQEGGYIYNTTDEYFYALSS